jgi:hypothetical protein
MTRRAFLSMLAAAPTQSPVSVPVRRIVDGKAKFPAGELATFWKTIWPEAVHNLDAGGIRLQVTDAAGEIGHTAADRPVFTGLQRGVLNLVLTDLLPLYWDNSRAIAGVTTIYEGFHLCLIALRYAHGNQVPFFSVNTCTHELLHALMQDIFLARPAWYQSGGREIRTDSYATALWMFSGGAAVRQSAREYVERLRKEPGAPNAGHSDHGSTR